MVEVVERGARGSKTYDLTPAGRDELRRWLVEEEPDRGQRNESGVRLFLTPLLDPEDRRAAFERDLAHVEAEIDELTAVQARVAGTDEPFAHQVELGLRLDAVIRDWLQERLAETGGR